MKSTLNILVGLVVIVTSHSAFAMGAGACSAGMYVDPMPTVRDTASNFIAKHWGDRGFKIDDFKLVGAEDNRCKELDEVYTAQVPNVSPTVCYVTVRVHANLDSTRAKVVESDCVFKD